MKGTRPCKGFLGAPSSTLLEAALKASPAVRATWRKLPSRRKGYNQKLKVGGQSIHLRTGEYEDGTLGEIFLDCGKYGSVVRNLLTAVAMTTSIGLQNGVPLEVYVSLFRGFWFPPFGEVIGDERIFEATSILDAVFHELELTYLKADRPASNGGLTDA
jgi:hypothetical protein